MRGLVTTILLLCMCFFALAKEAPVPVLRTDSSAVSVKKFDEQALSKYLDDPEFNYVEGKAPQPGLLELFWLWFWSLLGNAVTNGGIVQYILIGLGVAGLIYVIIKAAGIDMAGLFRRGARKTSLPYTESLENIHEINFDGEIDTAVSQRNFRLAVRLLYLKCLKQLSDRELIHWQIDKTNTAYYYELSNPGQREAFGELTRRFEYIWYGEWVIDEQTFGRVNQSFQQFKNYLA